MLDLEEIYIEPPNNRFKMNIIIGKGSFSKVYKVYDKKNKRDVAIKIINTLLFHDNENELDILKKLKQKEKHNITKLFESFNYNDHLYIIYKLYHINLKTYINTNKTPLTKTYKYINQILTGLDYLHKNEIIHRDIKPENIVFKNSSLNELIIIDFGISIKYNQPFNPTQTVQTIYYRAPEVFLQSKYEYNLDIWSLGCVAYELFYQKPLFPYKNTEELFINQNIILGHPDSLFIKKFSHIYEYYDNIVSPSYLIYHNKIYAFKFYNFLKIHKETKLIQFIIRCCEWDPSRRPYANEIFFSI